MDVVYGTFIPGMLDEIVLEMARDIGVLGRLTRAIPAFGRMVASNVAKWQRHCGLVCTSSITGYVWHGIGPALIDALETIESVDDANAASITDAVNTAITCTTADRSIEIGTWSDGFRLTITARFRGMICDTTYMKGSDSIYHNELVSVDGIRTRINISGAGYRLYTMHRRFKVKYGEGESCIAVFRLDWTRSRGNTLWAVGIYTCDDNDNGLHRLTIEGSSWKGFVDQVKYRMKTKRIDRQTCAKIIRMCNIDPVRAYKSMRYPHLVNVVKDWVNKKSIAECGHTCDIFRSQSDDEFRIVPVGIDCTGRDFIYCGSVSCGDTTINLPDRAVVKYRALKTRFSYQVPPWLCDLVYGKLIWWDYDVTD